MSEMAKKARTAMKAKAQSMTNDPQKKVDSSNWTPSEPLNAGIKTGMRPVSRAKFKSGGKVSGKHAKMNLGHKPRAAGGSAQPLVDRLINRDVKKANEYRDGIKHIGGMKRGGKAYCGGGRTMKEEGGRLRSESTQYEKARRRAVDEAENYDLDPAYTEDTLRKATSDFEKTAAETGNKRGGRIHKDTGGETLKELNSGVAPSQMGRKKGGRIHKADGGSNRIDAGVPSSVLNFSSNRSPAWQIAKRGGKIEHGDEAADKALIRKMVKPSARKGHASGGKTKLHFKEKGGSVYSGPSYPGKVPGATGGRTAHKHGGKTGKMAVHVNINTKPDAMMPLGAGPAAGPMPMPPIPPGLAGGRPLNPAQLGGGPAPMPGGAPPMPMAGGAPPMGGAPMGAPAMGARPSMQPIPRKSGGRLTKKASSYKDMEAGSGSGEGRLQKTDIARRH